MSERESGLEGLPPASSLEEEVSRLRDRSLDRFQELERKGGELLVEDVISEQIGHYRKKDTAETIDQSITLSEQELEALALDLEPEEHDDQMHQLLHLLRDKGIKNALRLVEKTANPHLEDDFHRMLVAYIKEGHSQGLSRNSELGRQLNMALYEVILPREAKTERETPLKELISSMEQFYAGMRSMSVSSAGPKHFVIEIALEHVGSQFGFYVAVPRDKSEMFEKQLIGIFPHASITEKKDDYNIFNPEGQTVASYASLAESPALPLKTYESFDFDPLNSILNSFSKLDVDGEGAAIQLVVSFDAADSLQRRLRQTLSRLEKGEPLWRALDVASTATGQLFKEMKHSLLSIGEAKKEPGADIGGAKVDQAVVEAVRSKLESTLVFSNLRLVSSSRTKEEAEDILSDIESAFNQLERSGGNRLKFSRPRGRALSNLLRDFSFRRFRFERSFPLSLREVSTFAHFQTAGLKEMSGLKKTYVQTAPPPQNVSSEGVLLGVNQYRGEQRDIRLASEDRLRHFYCIGQTGTGKSTLLKNMAVQDIENGEGVCVIDPHGSDLEDILAAVPPDRYDDVIYFDPSHSERPMALNMLEYDPAVPEQKTFVVNELFSIFQKLYSNVPESMGPMFEQYFRNATMLVVEDPETGNTLLDVSRVMTNKPFRDLKLSRCRNPIVVNFWREVAEKAGGEAQLANFVPYITSKFDVFLANDIMRPIVSQETSSFDFRQVMDEQKILLVNLSKGRLGELNSNLLGLIMVGKILMAALSRGTAGRDLPPFYLYIDEFQNVTTNSIATILSEARKYRLGLTVAHQFIAQLETSIKDAVFGNVGSMVAFRVGIEDGDLLEHQFSPAFTSADLANVQNRHAYVRLLIDGQPSDPFNISTQPPSPPKTEDVEQIKQLSWIKYGRDREKVEAEIMRKYQDLKSA